MDMMTHLPLASHKGASKFGGLGKPPEMRFCRVRVEIYGLTAFFAPKQSC